MEARIQCKEVEARLVDREVQLGLTLDSEARFRATFDRAAVGIAHIAPDGTWLRVNGTLCRILGYPADELLTKSLRDVTYPDDLAADLARMQLVREGKIDSYDAEKRLVRKDGVISGPGRLRAAHYKNLERSTRPALAPARNPDLRQLPAPTVH